MPPFILGEGVSNLLKNYVLRLWTSPRFLGSVVTGVTAALVAAGSIPAWATLVAVAAFAPVSEALGVKKPSDPQV